MYLLTDEQMEFIRNDISARGIAMVSLQQDLLDHICCIVENELEPGGDFGRFYPQVVSRFFKSELREIEEETVFLLTHKHYYTMKKTMISSGGLSVVLLSAGVILKFLHLPGAAVMIVLGTLWMSLVFLPLMFILRSRENTENQNKAVWFLGGLSAMLISLGVLFKIMHWPGANIMCISALLMMVFVFIPLYFFSGLRNPQTKVNTIVSSILMFTGCMLLLTLIRSPRTTRSDKVAMTEAFVESNQIVQHERQLAGQPDAVSREIYDLCEDLKSFLIEAETGLTTLGDDFETRDALLSTSRASAHFSENPTQSRKLKDLESAVRKYNETGKFPIRNKILDGGASTVQTLEGLNKIQLVVLQNQRKLMAAK